MTRLVLRLALWHRHVTIKTRCPWHKVLFLSNWLLDKTLDYRAYLTINLPSSDGRTQSKILADHINLMEKARISSKIRKALRDNTQKSEYPNVGIGYFANETIQIHGVGLKQFLELIGTGCISAWLTHTTQSHEIQIQIIITTPCFVHGKTYVENSCSLTMS